MKETNTILLSFHTGTDGMRAHYEFTEMIDKFNIEILNTYTTYHTYSPSPESLNYLVRKPSKLNIPTSIDTCSQ